MIPELQTRRCFGIKLNNSLFWASPIVTKEESFRIEGTIGASLGTKIIDYFVQEWRYDRHACDFY